MTVWCLKKYRYHTCAWVKEWWMSFTRTLTFSYVIKEWQKHWNWCNGEGNCCLEATEMSIRFVDRCRVRPFLTISLQISETFSSFFDFQFWKYHQCFSSSIATVFLSKERNISFNINSKHLKCHNLKWGPSSSNHTKVTLRLNCWALQNPTNPQFMGMILFNKKVIVQLKQAACGTDFST